MPKIISYTPSWLSRPSPGFQIFTSSHSKPNSRGADGQGSKARQNEGTTGEKYGGPKRTIATRGIEIFVVIDNEIRWTELCMLRDDWEEQQQKSKIYPDEDSERSGSPALEQDLLPKHSYRVLKVGVNEQIRQLKTSPNGQLLAIVTSHTVHVAVLPDSSHLGQTNSEPIRLKTHTIGPTTHVLSQPPVASVLWHPCGVAGSCLVTVTADAAVRVWELDRTNRWSFDSPSLAIDLKKLSLASSQEDDTTPYRINRNRGFSTDDIGMDVASACFGGTGSSGESAWSAMTLWVAMKEGDIYALCPLLPSKWQPSPTALPSLSTAIVSKASCLAKEDPTAQDTKQDDEQYRWIAEIDSQIPSLLPGPTEFSADSEFYNRPAHPGPTPALQGPFQLLPGNMEEELEISDIHVIAAKVDAEELMVGEDLDSELDLVDDIGLSASVVCLMTRSGRVYLCLDLEGVEGQWLPRKRPSHVMSLSENPYLIVLEALETLDASEIDYAEWPTFSSDPSSRYSLFTNNSRAVYFLALDPWLQTIETELQGSGIGTPFRIDVFRNGPGTLRERILLFKKDQPPSTDIGTTTCVIFQDSDLGYFLLTTADGQPQAATLDIPDVRLTKALDDDVESFYDEEANLLAIGPARSAYQPPAFFWQESSLTNFLDKHVHSRHKKIMKEEIRLSHATLDLMTEAHRILSQETHQLGLAAADLFRRCERLQVEFREQIKRVKETSERIDKLLGEDADGYERSEDENGNDMLNKRLDRARERQKELLARYEETRKRSAKIGGKDLSEREQAWVAEINKLKTSLLEPESGRNDNEDGKEDQSQNDDRRDGQHPPPPWQRYNEAKHLLTDLLSHAQDAQESSDSNPDADPRVPPELRKAKVEQVMGLLERESALVEATQARLERLGVGVVV